MTHLGGRLKDSGSYHLDHSDSTLAILTKPDVWCDS